MSTKFVERTVLIAALWLSATMLTRVDAACIQNQNLCFLSPASNTTYTTTASIGANGTAPQNNYSYTLSLMNGGTVVNSKGGQSQASGNQWNDTLPPPGLPGQGQWPTGNNFTLKISHNAPNVDDSVNPIIIQ